ncbi:hypothetical protein XAXN_19675 [Xanthomonas axonopodis]|uniref:Uncharacterized protein n=1 Tax=Xanthomonas axonopodis TaxID=53413 RepID=A0A0N8GD17_9XANT|nr:hypothetical protein XAXN_19675 [Xanthomonas axonopodis]
MLDISVWGTCADASAATSRVRARGLERESACDSGDSTVSSDGAMGAGAAGLEGPASRSILASACDTTGDRGPIFIFHLML